MEGGFYEAVQCFLPPSLHRRSPFRRSAHKNVNRFYRRITMYKYVTRARFERTEVDLTRLTKFTPLISNCLPKTNFPDPVSFDNTNFAHKFRPPKKALPGIGLHESRRPKPQYGSYAGKRVNCLAIIKTGVETYNTKRTLP